MRLIRSCLRIVAIILFFAASYLIMVSLVLYTYRDFGKAEIAEFSSAPDRFPIVVFVKSDHAAAWAPIIVYKN